MANAYFAVLDESPALGTYLASGSTVGPWDARMQHGGPPSALLVHAAERLAAAAPATDDLVAMRLGAEFIGPVPVGEVTTRARIVRAARSAVLVEATLAAGERDCLQARVWLVRRADTGALAADLGPAGGPSPDLPGLGASFPYADSIDWRTERGAFSAPGPAVVWARPLLPLVAGRALSGLQLAALVGDSASGVSSELDWAEWSFVNVDLDVHLARPVRGDWLRMDAATTIGTHGGALARSTLSDGHGPVGATAQTLVVAPRRR